FTDKRYADAAQLFEQYRQAFTSNTARAQAGYWAARSYEAAGQKDLAQQRLREVRQLDPLSYYGMRAADRLGVLFLPAQLAAAPAIVPLPADVSAALHRVDILDDLDMLEASDYEIERARRATANSGDAQYALAEALNARTHTDYGIALGRELLRSANNAWNPRLLRIVYPLPYYEIVSAESADKGIDPFLTAGLIRQESMFDADAVSPAGAVGLMQVMPGTGKEIARAVGVSSFDRRMLENPEVNATLGTIF